MGLCLFACLAPGARAGDANGTLLGTVPLGGREPRMASGASGAGQGGVAFTGELLGGSEEGAGVSSGYGALTVPLGTRFGVDLEGLSYHTGDEGLSGAGAHLYWRNPDVGLLGITASSSTADIAGQDEVPALNGIGNRTYGIEGELYLGPATLALQSGRIRSDLAEFEGKRYTAFDAQWWALRNWYWLAGTRHIADTTTNRLETGYTTAVGGAPVTVYGGGTWDAFDGQYVGLEFSPWQGRNSEWVAFAELDHGESGYHAFFLGVRYNFGPVHNAPLISLFDQVTGGF